MVNGNTPDETSEDLTREEALAEADFNTDVRWNRKRGILTKQDRKYLLGMVEPSGQQKRDINYRIRERVDSSFKDIILLADHYPDEELKKVKDRAGGEEQEIVFEPLLKLAYRLITCTIDTPGRFFEEDTTKPFERLIGVVLNRLEVGKLAANRDDEYVEAINVDIEAETRRPEKAIERLLANEGSREDLISVLNYGNISRLQEGIEQVGGEIVVANESKGTEEVVDEQLIRGYRMRDELFE
jgi:hypothetical protein